jgi:para-aminobenzoate synthetase component 1
LHAPLNVPTERLAFIVGALSEPALLEGGSGLGPAGRWSILTAEPRFVFESWCTQGWQTRWNGVMTRQGRSNPLPILAEELHRYDLANPMDRPKPGIPPFQGGLIGFIGYDLSQLLERRTSPLAPPDSRLPLIRFGLYDWAVMADHAEGTVGLWVFNVLGGETEAHLRERLERLTCHLSKTPAPPPRTSLESPILSNFTRSDYLCAVDRALEYIRAGDIYQVNLSQRFSASGRIEPLDLYLRLKRTSPAPFSAYLQWQDTLGWQDKAVVKSVISSSPEWFYRTEGERIVTRPIKGTRPRGATSVEDARLAQELARSVKDRAELTMIVDLERNDLGRVCEYGSVIVSEPLVVESFAQVHHLVATVEGRLRPHVGPIDIVRAVFPGGSITGAPKIRAMQIIDELEPTRRGLYTGAIGYFSRGGTSAFNIAIRTMLVEGNRVSYQVGGGIVADSTPEAEYEETLHKGRGLRSVLEGREEAEP